MVKSKKKKKTTKPAVVSDADSSIPRSFVFQRGDVGTTLSQLVADMKHVMAPYTAAKLKVRKANVLKDFVNVAGPLGISHFIILSKTEMSPYMKICRLPRGPTITFNVKGYSLMRDIVSLLKRPKTVGKQFQYPPLLVLNNFNTDTLQMKLLTTMLQNMYPSIKIQKVKLAEIRRCAMFNYDAESGTIDFRHYNIEAVPVGVSRGVKKLLKSKLPNLGSLNDISDYMTGAAYLSESEGEDPIDSQVQLPQRVAGQGNTKSSQSALRLTELGPRLTLELVKIEEGVCSGEVLYHKYVKKSAEEIKKLKKKKLKEAKEKEKRRKEQEKNVERKAQEKEENKKRSLAGMKRKAEEDQDDESDEEVVSEEEKEASDVDDADYYRQEVGDEPEEELFDKSTKKPNKKRKFSNLPSKKVNAKQKIPPLKQGRVKLSKKKQEERQRKKAK